MVKITVNGREVEADPGKPLIAACHANDEDVPHYCYHPGLTPVGSCRICQVQVQQGEMPPRVVVACRTPVAEGMVVDTEAPKAHDARRECLEFLLKNHPLDCPICDKAGECTLQDYSFDEGQGMGRSAEPRRELAKRKDLGDVILLDQERCILCSRCVRFMEEVPKSPQLTVSGLGSKSVISTFMDKPLSGNYQGNLADVCPVGALTLKEFRFQARVWNLTKTPGTCGECSRGCAVTHEVLRGGELKRQRPRFDENVNEWWMCDTGRFALDEHATANRLDGAVRRGTNGYQPVEPGAAIGDLAGVLKTNEGAVIVLSPWVTQEEAERLKSIAETTGAELGFVSPPANDLKDDLLHTGDPAPNRRGLTDLGIDAIDAEAAREKIAGAAVAVLVGERVCDLVGREELGEVKSNARLFVLDTTALDAPAVRASIGVPSFIERTGTWVNVDGHERRIAIARSAPPRTAELTRTLDELARRLAPAPASTGGGAL